MTSKPLSTNVLLDPRAWRADTIDDCAAWYYPLSERCLAALEQTIEQLRRAPRPVTTLPLAEFPCAACAEDLEPAQTALETGRGFVILTGLPLERYSVSEAQALYWLVGQMLGQPFAQNVQGTLLYDVRDTGQEVAKGARFSVTNAESTFHTDNSFGERILDYVGLLCLRTAKAGGANQVVSGYSVVRVLQDEYPDVLDLLTQPFHVDRRGGVRDGESPTTHVPILDWDRQELTVRYLRYWIEAGHQKIGQPLTPAQVRALDVFDAVLRRPDLRVEFALRPGEMFYINNRWILHNRTAFEDHPELERRRHYVRLWLAAPPIV